MRSILIIFLLSAVPQFQQREPPGSLVREEKIIKYTDEGVALIQVIEHMRPPFYRGKMPITYTSGKRDFSFSRITLWSDFGSFKNTFGFGDSNVPGVGASIPSSARATDRHGNLLAEARVVKLIKSVGFEVDESHYSGKSVIFRSRSSVDFSGYKIREVNVSGRKQREYFFFWPTGR